MDWIDEQVDKIKSKMKMSSLKRGLSIYIVAAILIVFALYILTSMYCESWRVVIYGRETSDIMEAKTLMDLAGLELHNIRGLVIINAIQNYSIILYSVIGIILATNLFYRNRMRDPIRLLKEEAAYISRNDLSVSCRYESGDEFGEVCEAFESMRLHLISNNENKWSLMEGQRLLNATFAHDIRTPLTVLQGYTDMLMRYYPEGKISEEKLLDTITLMQGQITRLREFSDSMKGLQDMEALQIRPSEKLFSHLVEQLQKNIEGLMQDQAINIFIHSNFESLNKEESKGYYDDAVIIEVVNNLISNSCSYAKNLVEIYIELEKTYLYIYVCDDGRGFSREELYSALNPYYSSRNDGAGHFGIGLTICKILCEKHGGKITLSNSISKGAIVCASFRVI